MTEPITPASTAQAIAPPATPAPANQATPTKGSFLDALTKAHVSYKDREYFTENLALLLKSAVPIGDALNSLSETSQTDHMKKALAQMGADIESGYNLANALERSGLVSSQTLALVRLGEASGHLVENLQLAAVQEEKRHTFRAKVRSALIYPIFVMGLTAIVGLGVAWFLLPKLAATFSGLKVKLPLISRIMIGLGLFLKAHGIVAVPLFLVLCAVVAYILFGAPKTKYLGQRLLMLIPGIGSLMREVEIAQFGYLLGTLLEAGLSVTQALDLLSKASNLNEYRAFYTYLSGTLENGYSFRESLNQYKKHSKILPPAVEQMVVAGERSGSLAEVLMMVGRTYEQKSDVTTSNLEAVVEPVLLVFVSAGVLLVALAVIVPIYSLVGGLSQ